MKKTYITPAAEAVGLNPEGSILNASGGTVEIVNDDSKEVDNEVDAWSRFKGAWSCSNWSDTGNYE